jgi:hypothetical protein
MRFQREMLDDFIEGGVASYSRVLNSEKRLKAIQDLNRLTVTCAGVLADNQAKKMQKMEAKKKKDAAAAKNKEDKRKKEEELRVKVLPELEEKMRDFEQGRMPVSAFGLLPKSKILATSSSTIIKAKSLDSLVCRSIKCCRWS